jgi:hypothetical protein
LFNKTFSNTYDLSLYRQSAFTISKLYIEELIQQADFYRPKVASDPTKVIAAGFGHHPRVLLIEYIMIVLYLQDFSLSY